MVKSLRYVALAGLIGAGAVLGGCYYEPGYYGGGPGYYAPQGYYSFSYRSGGGGYRDRSWHRPHYRHW